VGPEYIEILRTALRKVELQDTRRVIDEAFPNTGFARHGAHWRRREDPGPGERLRHISDMTLIQPTFEPDPRPSPARNAGTAGYHCLHRSVERRLLGARLESTRITHPFLLRTFDPPIAALYGRRVVAFRRVGKRIAIVFEGDHCWWCI